MISESDRCLRASVKSKRIRYLRLLPPFGAPGSCGGFLDSRLARRLPIPDVGSCSLLFFVAPDTSGWAESARHADPVARAEGLPAIDAMIAGVQGRFPGFRFALMDEPTGHGEFVRFRWTFGPPGAEPPIEGAPM